MMMEEDGNLCPFCGISSADPADLLVHVNQHLTPENDDELLSFIDDRTPRFLQTFCELI